MCIFLQPGTLLITFAFIMLRKSQFMLNGCCNSLEETVLVTYTSSNISEENIGSVKCV